MTAKVGYQEAKKAIHNGWPKRMKAVWLLELGSNQRPTD